MLIKKMINYQKMKMIKNKFKQTKLDHNLSKKKLKKMFNTYFSKRYTKSNSILRNVV